MCLGTKNTLVSILCVCTVIFVCVAVGLYKLYFVGVYGANITVQPTNNNSIATGLAGQFPYYDVNGMGLVPTSSLSISAGGIVTVGASSTNSNGVFNIYTDGSSVPRFDLRDGDLQNADWSSVYTGANVLSNSTIGRFISSQSASGGLTFAGFSSTGTNDGVPLRFDGYHGGTAPTTAALVFQAWKHNGSTNRTGLSSSEKALQFNSGVTNILTQMGDGRLGINTTSPIEDLTVYDTSSAVTLGTTTTLFIDTSSSTKGACIALKDADGSGFTYLVANNGALEVSINNCR